MNLLELCSIAREHDFLVFNAEHFIDKNYFELVKILESQNVSRETLDFEFGFALTKYSPTNLESAKFFFNQKELENFLFDYLGDDNNFLTETNNVEPFLISDDLFEELEGETK